MTYAFVRAALEPTGEYRFIDSTTRLGITHKASNTKLRAISSNAKSAFGLVNVPMAVIDEPGALEIVGGQMMADALFTAQGKVGSALKLVLIGTLSPMATGPAYWWYVFSPPLTPEHKRTRPPLWRQSVRLVLGARSVGGYLTAAAVCWKCCITCSDCVGLPVRIRPCIATPASDR